MGVVPVSDTQDGGSDQLDESVINENDEIWAGAPRDLGKKLDRYYGVEGLRLQGDFYHEGRDEILYDVLVFFDGDDYRYIADDVTIFGHGPSGAAGVDPGHLPQKKRVREVVEAAEDGGGG